ncbi:MAG: bifunctional [glutamate--ammonia ligase]-adenylyl-L-tyrosine phosphorylase/[glutamate--ammonia-ligase] adenylyltransferase [Alphaproteobacteria bacterium]|nr:bifunctional [glutamate--ammonia ligase]-adenylyl-L-tyrosine phosphorylase/[glutamate--ammonia-ligase] adenylyltransferase [Alphaproteobacteria bacterium]
MISQVWSGLKAPELVPESVELLWQRWQAAAGRIRDEELKARALDLRPAAEGILDPVFRHSPYLSRCVTVDPVFAMSLISDGPDAAFDVALAMAEPDIEGETEKDLMTRLRRAKRRVHLTAGLADISSLWSLEQITGNLSQFAETALRTACRHLLRALHARERLTLADPMDAETACGLFVLGMGKLGAGELNYSSDIDLIILFDPEIVPEDLQRTMTRLAQGLTRIIDAQTADGYVFRTDLRLRPDPSSTPPAISTVSAGTYYRESARNWERAAMIKARTVAGDTARGEIFLENLHPFIWRHHLDFAAMQDIRTIKQQIDSSRSRDGGTFMGRNVKLGGGGIREIEFYVQAQQLIWGGRESALRTRGTCETLDILVAGGHVAHGAAIELKEAYRFLRTLEHRLQMVDDRQTHSLPGTAEGIGNIAAFSGFADADALERSFLDAVAVVERHYANLFAERVESARQQPMDFTGDTVDDTTRKSLRALGYREPERAAATVIAWKTKPYPALRAPQAIEHLMRLAPSALAVFAGLRDCDGVLMKFDEFLSRLPAGTSFLSLVSAHPNLLELLGEILGVAPYLSRWLTRKPALLDSVLAREFTDLSFDDEDLEAEIAETARRGLVRLFYTLELDRDEMASQLAEATGRARDLQDVLDEVRRWANDKVFQIGVHLLEGMLTPVEAARPLSDIADACIAALLPVVEMEFEADHGRIPGGSFAIVAFGKLGSREMTVSSDLDLMFLYDQSGSEAVSDGRKPLPATQYYARLCRRLITAITAPTREGRLYDVDMRLRPSGKAGPIACSLNSFESYQHENAWTWEHQALTRARVVAASGQLGDDFSRVRHDVLTLARSQEVLAGDVIAMRDRIREENRAREETIKHMPGGLLDVEFIAQYLELLHARDTPAILAGNTIGVFERASDLSLIDADVAVELGETTALWNNLQGMARLTGNEDGVASLADTALMERLGGQLVSHALVDSIDHAAKQARLHFATILDIGTKT